MSQRNRTNVTPDPKKISWINEFLWTCAGVNKAVLRQCPSDYAKYAGIGGTILFTALMAALSGGYALNFVFDNKLIAFAFGIFWGLLIFNLDRFIVNTMYSDGKHTISWAEIRSGLPRIVMAIFLGIVISTPLELKIFEDKIKMEIEKEKHKLLEDQLSELSEERLKLEDQIVAVQQGAGDLYGDHIHTGNQQIDALSDSIDVNQPILNSIQTQLNNLSLQKRKLDKESESYSSQLAAINAKERPLISRRSILSSNLKRWRAERATLQKEIGGMATTQTNDKRELIAKLRQEKDSIANLIAQARTLHPTLSADEIRQKGSLRDKINLEYSGFNAELKAFSDIRKDDPATDIAAWFVMFLFIIIETAPTFFKMMMEDGPYDHLLNAEKHRVKVMSDKRISDVNDEINTAVRISTMKNEKRLEAETIANQDILEKIARAQAELLETAIARWKEIELEKIRQNPSDYVVSLVPPRHEVEVVTRNDDNLTEVSAMTSQQAEDQHSENLNAVSEDNNPETDSESQTETRGDEGIDGNIPENTNAEHSER